MSMAAIVYPDDLPIAAARLASLDPKSHPSAPIQLRILRKDGSFVWVSSKTQPYARRDGEVRFLCASRDITEQKRAEDELEEHRDHLEALVEERTGELLESSERLRESERLASIGTLAAGIAHQINNPIGMILTGSQFALLCEDDDDAHELWRRTLHENAEQAERCGRIVRSVLKFSRETGEDKVVYDANEAVARAYQLTTSYAAGENASLELDLVDEELPLEMNLIEMEQVFVNIIRNAVEASPHGKPISVRTRRADDRVLIEVQDRGVGIPPEDVHRVFDPFFTRRLRSGGTGLGLSVAHGIVSDHGGEISVETEVGAGTTVRVELPIVELAEA